jgi:hypothetical protein
MTDSVKTEEPKTILILKSNPISLQSSEQFLRSRGWNIISTVNLAETVKVLFQTKVDYLLICANHSQKKVRSLPNLILQFKQIRIITYTDIANTVNMSILKDMGINYQVLPPVSGPAIERMIFRIEKDLAQPKDSSRNLIPKGFLDQPNSSITIKSVQERLSVYLSNDSDDAIPNLDSIIQGIPESSSTGEFAFQTQGSTSTGPYALTEASPVAQDLASVTPGSQTPKNVETPTQPQQNPTSTNESDAESSSRTESFADYEERMRKQSAGGFVDKDAQASTKSGKFAFRAPRGNSSGPNSIIPSSAALPLKNGIEKAMDSSVSNTKLDSVLNKIEKAQNCICLNVEADRFRGFLVAAMGKNRRFDDELLFNIQTKLYEFLRSQNVAISEDKPIEIKVKPVDFEGWALDQAEFLKKSIHNGNEVAMAFFPSDRTTPNFGESASTDMLTVDIDDLDTDAPVTFDVYIHLPANNRYILYTPKGGIFMGEQKERLKLKGVGKLHMKKESTPEIKKYHVENTLNKTIQKFEDKPEEKSEEKRKKA